MEEKIKALIKAVKIAMTHRKETYQLEGVEHQFYNYDGCFAGVVDLYRVFPDQKEIDEEKFYLYPPKNDGILIVQCKVNNRSDAGAERLTITHHMEHEGDVQYISLVYDSHQKGTAKRYMKAFQSRFGLTEEESIAVAIRR